MKNQDFFNTKLLPAVTMEDVNTALKLAETYLEAGLDIMEITFRTDAASEAIREIAKNYPEMKVGAGTLLSAGQIKKAKDAGAQFGLSPGLNEHVVRAAVEHSFSFIPGVSTPSEIEMALEFGCSVLKLFPADLLGGAAYIKSMEGPYQKTGVKFIPMGGVNIENLSVYLGFSSVIAAGGSWIAPRDPIRNNQFGKVREIVRRSLEIAQQT